MMYPFSRLFNVASTAMVTLKSINIFIGTTSTLSTFILELLAEEDQVCYIVWTFVTCLYFSLNKIKNIINFIIPTWKDRRRN